MWFYDFRCDRCRRLEVAVVLVLARYRLDDGRELKCFEQPVWCDTCDGIRCAERLPEADWIESQIRELKDSGLDNKILKSLKMIDRDPEEFLTERLEDFRAMLEWRHAREAPPRCWNCGSTDFMALTSHPDDEPQSFAHPSCGGLFECDRTGHALQKRIRRFDSEGFEIKT